MNPYKPYIMALASAFLLAEPHTDEENVLRVILERNVEAERLDIDVVLAVVSKRLEAEGAL